MHENKISGVIIDACIQIHKELGAGLFESVYEEVLAYELTQRGLSVERQKGIKVKYKEIEMDIGFRADLIINNKVIIELKSVENIHPVHKKQLLTYLKLSDKKLGLLINFNVDLLKHGITRIVNNLF